MGTVTKEQRAELLHRLYIVSFNLGLDWNAKTPEQAERVRLYQQEARELLAKLTQQA